MNGAVQGLGALDEVIDSAMVAEGSAPPQGDTSQQQQPAAPPEAQANPDPWADLGFPPGESPTPNSSESQGEQQGAGEQEGQVPAGVDDPNSYKFFQSKYDQAVSEKAKMQEQLDLQNQQIQYLMQQGQSNAVNQQAQLSTGQQQMESQVPQQLPQKPIKPVDFDPIDAQTDPQSASAQYLQAHEAYREASFEAMQSQLQYQSQLLEQERIRVREETQEQSYRHELAQTHGLTPEEVDDFFRVMNDPNTMTMPNMVQLYRLQKGGQQAQVHQRTMPQRATIPVPPLPQSTASAAPREPVRSDVDTIVDDLVALGSQDDIFPM